MVASLIFEKIVIKSRLNDYTISFVDDFLMPLNNELNNGSFLITDSNVYRLYLENSGMDLSSDNVFIVKASERNKSIDKCKEIVEVLVDKQIRRNQRIVAIGGGVVQDLAAFTASIYFRGIEWSFFPTTLLAQADSCIGGKTSINLESIKNIIGNFYPPAEIYLDVGFLETLSEDDIKSGIGEILHYYFYSNSSFMFEMMDSYNDLILNPQGMIKYIRESLLIKKRVIEVDEFDGNERNKFNYGHTFGHAIETSTNYEIKHGQAVTVGMDIANYISNYLGLIDLELYKKMKNIIEVNFPDYNWSSLDIHTLIESLSKDKKNEGNKLGCILTKGPGSLVKKFLPIDDELKLLISNYFEKLR